MKESKNAMIHLFLLQNFCEALHLYRCREDCGCVSQLPGFCDSGMIGVTRRNRRWRDDKKPRRQDKCDVVAKIILFVKQPLTIFICQKLLGKT